MFFWVPKACFRWEIRKTNMDFYLEAWGSHINKFILSRYIPFRFLKWFPFHLFLAWFCWFNIAEKKIPNTYEMSKFIEILVLIANVFTQLSSVTWCLKFGLHMLAYYVCASGKGIGKTVQMCRLLIIFWSILYFKGFTKSLMLHDYVMFQKVYHWIYCHILFCVI